MDNFTADLFDNNTLNITGNTKSLNAKLGVNAKLQAFDFEALSAKVEAKDNASAEINVKEKMEAKTIGSAQIRYRGEPSVSRSVQEGGSVEKE
jgi:transketolase N-terminal domain/subunit